jgi:uncharacterized protein YbjT (DUF2867 family)
MTHSAILIIGATGTVGSQLAGQLREAGYRFRVLARDVRKLDALGAAADIVYGDLARPATLTAAFRGMKKVFVVAPPVAELEELEANAFVAAEHAGIEHVVYLSNFGADTFDEGLWRAHGANERRLRASQASWTILRPVRFMSNIPYGWASVRDKGLLLEPLGGGKVTMIAPTDIAAVALKALTEPGHESKIYELVGEALAGEDIARCLSQSLGRSIRFVDAREDEVREDLTRSGIPAATAEKILYYFATLRQGRWYETPTLAQVLKRPARNFRDWLASARSIARARS